MKVQYMFVCSLFTLILILSVIQVIISSKLSTTGVVLGKLDDQISEYKRENVKLQEKFLDNASYGMIASHAAELGFSQSKARIYITASEPLALKQ